MASRFNTAQNSPSIAQPGLLRYLQQCSETLCQLIRIAKAAKSVRSPKVNLLTSCHAKPSRMSRVYVRGVALNFDVDWLVLSLFVGLSLEAGVFAAALRRDLHVGASGCPAQG